MNINRSIIFTLIIISALPLNAMMTLRALASKTNHAQSTHIPQLQRSSMPIDQSQQGIIENIVFDIGGVLLDGNTKTVTDTLKMQGYIIPQNFSEIKKLKPYAEWQCGRITKEHMIEQISQRFDHSLVTAFIDYHIRPDRACIDESVIIANQLKSAGYRLFILSNFSHDSYHTFIPHYPFFKLFEGMVFSCQTGSLKPDAAIYQSLLSRYQLQASKTLFIDDTLENVEAAQELGIAGVHYKPGKLKEQLEQYGIDLKSTSNCIACTPVNDPIIALVKTKYFCAFLHPTDQKVAGRIIIQTHDHIGSLVEWSDEMWIEFGKLQKAIQKALAQSLYVEEKALLVNVACLMNLARKEGTHTHFHIVPRHEKPLRLLDKKTGQEFLFVDKEYGKPFQFGNRLQISESMLETISSLIKEQLDLSEIDSAHTVDYD